ncbi:MAG: PTS sugar transporter subunit IIA [Gemmatimonadaceae bacterium]
MSSVRAIVAGHGDFAAGMLSAVEQITGRGDMYLPLTNRGLSAADVAASLQRLLEDTGARVVFTDLPAGSCTMAARRLQRERPDVAVVVGVNLAALLDFVFDEADDVVAARQAAEKGRTALTMLGARGPRGA